MIETARNEFYGPSIGAAIQAELESSRFVFFAKNNLKAATDIVTQAGRRLEIGGIAPGSDQLYIRFSGDPELAQMFEDQGYEVKTLEAAGEILNTKNLALNSYLDLE